MEWLIVLIVIVVIIAILARAADNVDSRSNGSEDPFNNDESVITDVSRSKESRVSGVEYIQTSNDGTYLINPESPLPIRLSGCTRSQAHEIKTLLDDNYHWTQCCQELSFLMKKHGIKCPELQDFMTNIRENVTESVKHQCRESNEWEDSSERDREDLIAEFRRKALTQLPIKPASERALQTLMFGVPDNFNADAELLSQFSASKLYGFYIRRLDRKTDLSRVSADHVDRKSWEQLVEIGLAKRGKDIPVKVLVGTLRVKDINALFADRLEKRLRLKAHAIDFAANQRDIMDFLSREISFREMFQISRPEEAILSEIQACYEYALAESRVIFTTYSAGRSTLDRLQQYSGMSRYGKWEITADNCSPKCERLDGKRTKRKPARVPPFHFGCNCSLHFSFD